jgi:tetratricopeptide (TPR) repeat protein
VQIAALDRINTLASRPSSPELDAAVSAYVESYPSTQRTAKLVLRHAMRGTLDEQLAIDTLTSIPDNDPIALPARRTLLQLQYQLLRGNRFSDMNMLREARSLADWILAQEPQDEGRDQTHVGVLQIAIDLSLRDSPPDSMYARELIEIARQLIASEPSLATLEAELLSQLIRAELLDDRIEQALVVLDELRVVDPDRADDAQMLVLNTLIEQWSVAHSPRVAQYLVEVGSPVIARVVKPAQESISVQTSALMEIVAEAALQRSKEQDEAGMLELALRLSKRVLSIGQPSEPGLRRTAELAAELSDIETQLEAWLRLLAAYPQDDDRWYEARYHSLKAMQQVDPSRAFDTYKQYKVLNPTLGPDPWNQRIANLFGEAAPENPKP